MIVENGFVTSMLLQRIIDNQRKAAAKTDRHENEKCEEVYVIFLGADVDMEKVFKQGFINIKERR